VGNNVPSGGETCSATKSAYPTNGSALTYGNRCYPNRFRVQAGLAWVADDGVIEDRQRGARALEDVGTRGRHCRNCFSDDLVDNTVEKLSKQFIAISEVLVPF
jgi:hypothetical protein